MGGWVDGLPRTGNKAISAVVGAELGKNSIKVEGGQQGSIFQQEQAVQFKLGSDYQFM